MDPGQRGADERCVERSSARERERVIRPAAVLPERAAREILAWLATHDVSQGGSWSSGVGTIQRYSGPFDGPSGMRGSAVLLGGAFLVESHRLHARTVAGTDPSPMRLFHWSITYLALLFLAVAVDQLV